MRVFSVMALLISSVQAAEIRGRLVNGSTGGQGEAEEVKLVIHERMMESVATLTDVRGSFVFSAGVQGTPSRFLVQAVKGGVVYSQGVRSFEEPVVLTVYDVSSDVALDVALDSIAVFAYGDRMDVGCFYHLRNQSDPPVVLDRQGPTLTFPLIDGVENLEVNTRFGSGMSLRQRVEVRDQAGLLSYPLKPGLTQMMVTATRAYDVENGSSFSLELPQEQAPFKIVALPRSIELSGAGVVFEQADVRENLNVYAFDPGAAGEALVLRVRGTPAERRMASEPEPAAEHGDIRTAPNPLDRWRWPIVGAILVLLSLAAARVVWRS